MDYDKPKKPNPSILGTGAASKAGNAISKRNKTQKARIDEMMGKKPKKNNYR